MKYTPEEVAKILADRPQQQQHYIEAMIRKCIAEATPAATGAEPAVTVRYDLSPAMTEGAIRDQLIAMGWAPPAQDEAVRRDAERYRWLRDRGFAHADVSLGTDCDGDHFVGYRITFNLPEPPHNKFEDDEWEADDIDAAIDAAIAQRGDVE